MRPTTRGWTVIGLWGALLATAVVVESALPLVGGALLGGYLLAAQAAAVRAFADANETLDVAYDTASSRALAGGDVFCTLAVDGGERRPARVRIRAPIPVSVEGPDAAQRTVELAEDDRGAEVTFSVTVRVAGTVALPAPELHLEDARGLFEETLRAANGPSVTVTTRSSGRLHVGQGGTELEAAHGEHDAGGLRGGVVPAELREYVAGEPANRIDWKTTARYGTPYIREFEAETDRRTLVLLDHRESMERGSEGTRRLDYAREAGLGVLETAVEGDDPLGLYAVGDEGLTARISPAQSPETYARIRSHLLTLESTAAPSARVDGAVGDTAGLRAVAGRLDPGGGRFDRTLAAFATDPSGYVERLEADPLYAAARRALHAHSGATRLVVITDDARRDAVREIVKLGALEAHSVAVFLLPDVLFGEASLADVETAYERYREFEDFRKELSRLDDVAAFEVGPGDRLAAILEGVRGTPQ